MFCSINIMIVGNYYSKSLNYAVKDKVKSMKIKLQRTNTVRTTTILLVRNKFPSRFRRQPNRRVINVNGRRYNKIANSIERAYQLCRTQWKTAITRRPVRGH